MIPLHEEFVHFATCMQRLNSAWVTLNAIKVERDNALVGPAFRFALVEYAAPYSTSYGTDKKCYKLNESYVPVEFLELHHRILDARSSIHAHADMTVMDAKLYITETRGMPSAVISGNYIHGLEEIGNIEQIILLIEGTLLKMYADEDARLRALQP